MASRSGPRAVEGRVAWGGIAEAVVEEKDLGAAAAHAVEERRVRGDGVDVVPADGDEVHLAAQVLEHGQLVRDLAAAHDGHGHLAGAAQDAVQAHDLLEELEANAWWGAQRASC